MPRTAETLATIAAVHPIRAQDATINDEGNSGSRCSSPRHLSAVPDTVDVTLPAMGESVTEGTVARWVKAVGDSVTEGETVAEVTTDKVDVEVPAPAAGTLAEIVVGEGDTAAVGATLARIASGATATDGAPPAPPSPQPAASQPASPPPAPPQAAPQPTAPPSAVAAAPRPL